MAGSGLVASLGAWHSWVFHWTKAKGFGHEGKVGFQGRAGGELPREKQGKLGKRRMAARCIQHPAWQGAGGRREQGGLCRQPGMLKKRYHQQQSGAFQNTNSFGEEMRTAHKLKISSSK